MFDVIGFTQTSWYVANSLCNSATESQADKTGGQLYSGTSPYEVPMWVFSVQTHSLIEIMHQNFHVIDGTGVSYRENSWTFLVHRTTTQADRISPDSDPRNSSVWIEQVVASGEARQQGQPMNENLNSKILTKLQNSKLKCNKITFFGMI